MIHLLPPHPIGNFRLCSTLTEAGTNCGYIGGGRARFPTLTLSWPRHGLVVTRGAPVRQRARAATVLSPHARSVSLMAHPPVRPLDLPSFPLSPTPSQSVSLIHDIQSAHGSAHRIRLDSSGWASSIFIAPHAFSGMYYEAT